MKFRKTVFPKRQDRLDYDLTAYDTEYGGVVSNFTSSVYDENPPLYPNPEVLGPQNSFGKMWNLFTFFFHENIISE